MAVACRTHFCFGKKCILFRIIQPYFIKWVVFFQILVYDEINRYRSLMRRRKKNEQKDGNLETIFWIFGIS